MTRIRYKKKDNYLISSVFLIEYDVCYIRINTTYNRWYLINSKRKVIDKGQEKTLDKTKRVVKDMLKKYDVNFDGEIRLGVKDEADN